MGRIHHLCVVCVRWQGDGSTSLDAAAGYTDNNSWAGWSAPLHPWLAMQQCQNRLLPSLFMMEICVAKLSRSCVCWILPSPPPTWHNVCGCRREDASTSTCWDMYICVSHIICPAYKAVAVMVHRLYNRPGGASLHQGWLALSTTHLCPAPPQQKSTQNTQTPDRCIYWERERKQPQHWVINVMSRCKMMRPKLCLGLWMCVLYCYKGKWSRNGLKGYLMEG